jgi:hypothetical protein
MKVLKFLSIVTMLFFISCSKEESPKETKVESEIQAYQATYMHYGPSYNEAILVKLNYDSDNKITKRIGGLTPLPPTLGVGDIFTDQTTDDLIYSNNEIKITKKISNCNNCSFETKIILDNQNRILKKVIYKPNPEMPNDTILYTYNNLGLIDETIKLKGKIIDQTRIKAKFYYNQKQNLDSIVTKTYSDFFKPVVTKQLEIFSNYDNATNPLKKLILFEETFLRAISKNNYTKYEKYNYSANNQLNTNEIRNWTFKYDASGNINFEF